MSEKVVLERDDLRRTLRRIAHEMAEANPEPERLAIVGIHTRGVFLARRLHALVGDATRHLPADAAARAASVSSGRGMLTRFACVAACRIRSLAST